MKKIALILKSNTQTDFQEKLIQGLLCRKDISFDIYLQGENKAFVTFWEKKKVMIKKWPDSVFLLPEKSKIGAVLATFKNAPFVFSFLRTEKPDMVMALDMSILCALAPFCFIAQKRLFWIQTHLWGNFPAGTLFMGYTKDLIAIDEAILNSFPASLKHPARLICFDSKDTAALLNNIIGCN